MELFVKQLIEAKTVGVSLKRLNKQNVYFCCYVSCFSLSLKKPEPPEKTGEKMKASTCGRVIRGESDFLSIFSRSQEMNMNCFVHDGCRMRLRALQ